MSQSASWDGPEAWETADGWTRRDAYDETADDFWEDPLEWQEEVQPVGPLADTGEHAPPVADDQPAIWEEEYWDRPNSRRQRRQDRLRHRAEAREARWRHNRFAVPYRTDGPKITFGVIWFVAIVAASWSSPIAVAVVASLVAAVAGLQAGMAWFPDVAVTKWWTALAALVAGLGGWLGPGGLGAGIGLALAVLGIYVIAYPIHERGGAEVLDVMMRSSLPVGLAAGSLAALAEIDLGAVLSLIALVSAYEVGDFLVGSGSSNAVEGPISGLVALGAALFIVWLAAPTPFSANSVVLFGALAAVCCPLGQILGSALLPHGNAWAPGIRRLDSYLLSAPLWLLLLETSPTASTL